MAEFKPRASSRMMTLDVRECCDKPHDAEDCKEHACGEEEPKREIRVSVSSEEPVPETVFDEDTGEWVRANEILGHADGEIDFSRMADGLVIQDTHGGDQIGLIRKVEVRDGKLGGTIEFCCGPRAQEIKCDAERGLRRNMSVGYIVNRWRKCGDAEKRGGLPTYRATSWTPYEASFVNVPADTRVGVDRELDITKTAAETAAQNTQEIRNMDTPETQAVQSAELNALKDEVRALREQMKPEVPAERAKPQFDEAETKTIVRKYDFFKAVRSLAGDRGVDCGYEREISQEIAHQTGREAKGFFVPDAVLAGRAFDKGTNAGNLVATETLFGEMVPALVAKTVLGQAGVRVLSGLVGDIKIPTGSAAAASWNSAEGVDATETTPTIGSLTATPKGLNAYTDITRELSLQSGISAQAFVTDALINAMARKLETAAFSGSGSSGQPRGLDNIDTINTVASATNPGLAKVLEFITAIEAENADTNGGKFIGRPAVWALLGSTIDYTAIEASGSAVGGVTSGKYLLDTATNTCQGYDFIKSNLATAKYLYFGDWSKMMFAMWSGVDITVDPYTLSLSGKLRIVAHQNVDVVVTQPKAFSRGQVIS